MIIGSDSKFKVYGVVAGLLGTCLILAYHHSARVLLEDLSVVGDHDDGGSLFLVDSCEKFHDTVCGFVVEVSCRLVCNDHFRVVEKRTCNGDSLLLASRELVRHLVGLEFHSDGLPLSF